MTDTSNINPLFLDIANNGITGLLTRVLTDRPLTVTRFGYTGDESLLDHQIITDSPVNEVLDELSDLAGNDEITINEGNGISQVEQVYVTGANLTAFRVQFALALNIAINQGELDDEGLAGDLRADLTSTRNNINLGGHGHDTRITGLVALDQSTLFDMVAQDDRGRSDLISLAFPAVFDDFDPVLDEDDLDNLDEDFTWSVIYLRPVPELPDLLRTHHFDTVLAVSVDADKLLQIAGRNLID